MKILSIHYGHTASVSYFSDGVLQSSISEERLNKLKGYSGIPKLSFEYILKKEEINLEAIDLFVVPFITTGFSPTLQKNQSWILKVAGIVIQFVILWMLKLKLGAIKQFLEKIYLKTFGYLKVKSQTRFISKQLGIDSKKILTLPHHLCHAASAYFASTFANTDCLVLTLDGEGDGISASVNKFSNSKIEIVCNSKRNSSIGLLYMHVTKYLGMKPNEHEYKLMGLAPYAKPEHASIVKQIFEEIFTFGGNSGLEIICSIDADYFPTFLRKKLDGFRFDNIAGGLQMFVEDFISKWVIKSMEVTGNRNICAAGGVFMNVKLNQRISELSSISNFWVLPSCGDETAGWGAASLAFRLNKTQIKIESQSHILNGKYQDTNYLNSMYLGKTEIESENLEAQLKKSFSQQIYNIDYCADINTEVAKLLNQNQIVARFTGDAEFGARALGNRSILGNPLDPDTVRVINEKLKNRDFWMPFAPTIIDKKASDYIILNPKTNYRFMMVTAPSTPLGQKFFKAAMHPYDLTLRVQILEKMDNQMYYDLIEKFMMLSGIGGVLNTSFNLHGMPIVSGIQDASTTMDNSGLNFLAIENFMISKNQNN